RSGAGGLAGDRRAGEPERRPSAGADRDVLPRPFGGGGRFDARHSAGHGQVAHVLRAARAAIGLGRKRSDGTMTAGGCADARICLGAYVLGALDPAERGRVDAHLADCDSCRDELASFAALPGLLSRASIAEVELVPDGPRPELLHRLLTAVASERKRDRRV